MLFKILSKASFKTLVNGLLESNEVVGPQEVKRSAAGEPIYQFLPVDKFENIRLDYDKSEFSAKTYFLPFRENLSRYKYQDGDWQQEIRYRIQPRALIGLHACDINALVKLDKVMLKGNYPSPYYLSRRKNTFVLGIDHMPNENCFCSSVGADIVTHGFDLFLTDIGDRYFVAVDSDRGYRVLRKVEIRDVTEKDRQAYMNVRQKITKAFKTQVNIRNLPTILDLEFESPVWKKWGDKCLSCGSCAMVCPTCYCYGVDENVSMDFKESDKSKQLYSCTLLDFAQVAGDHNFRPTRESRLKYRYYHQHRGFVETYDEPKCVGCNRCGDTCLAGINPPEVISDIEKEDLKMKISLQPYDVREEMSILDPLNFQRRSLLQHVDSVFKAEITNIVDLNETEKLFHIRILDPTERNRFQFLPGQFVMVELPGYGEVPISISSSPSNKGHIELCIRKAGYVTGLLHGAKPGAKVGLRGPFGTHFPLGMMKGKNVLLIAGGLGLVPLRAPIFYVTENLGEFKDVHIIYGAKRPKDLLFDYQYEQWRRIYDVKLSITVEEPDDSWKGDVGLITSLLDNIDIDPHNTFAIVCGPPVMFKFVCNRLSDMGIPMQRMFVSLERRMHCGMGKCCRCNIGSTYTCVDGPVFDYWTVLNLKEAI